MWLLPVLSRKRDFKQDDFVSSFLRSLPAKRSRTDRVHRFRGAKPDCRDHYCSATVWALLLEQTLGEPAPVVKNFKCSFAGANEPVNANFMDNYLYRLRGSNEIIVVGCVTLSLYCYASHDA